MAKKKEKLVMLNREHKEAMAKLQSHPEFKGFLNFLRTQQNNIGIIQWRRIKSNDPDIAIKKANYEGQFDIIRLIIRAFEEAKEGEDE